MIVADDHLLLVLPVSKKYEESHHYFTIMKCHGINIHIHLKYYRWKFYLSIL